MDTEVIAVVRVNNKEWLVLNKYPEYFYKKINNRTIVGEDINKIFPNAKIIQGDIFGSVGLGLTLDAIRKFN